MDWKKRYEVTVRRIVSIGLLLLLASLAFGQISSVSREPSISMEKLEVQLRLGGLYPKSLTVVEGAYEITLVNTAFLAPVALALLDNTSTALVENEAESKFRARRRLKVDLKPGTHKLQIVGHPRWTSELIVTPKEKR